MGQIPVLEMIKTRRLQRYEHLTHYDGRQGHVRAFRASKELVEISPTTKAHGPGHTEPGAEPKTWTNGKESGNGKALERVTHR